MLPEEDSERPCRKALYSLGIEWDITNKSFIQVRFRPLEWKFFFNHDETFNVILPPKSLILVSFSALKSKIFFNHGEKLNKMLLKILHSNAFQCSLFERFLQTWWSIKNPYMLVWFNAPSMKEFSSTFFGKMYHFWGNIVKYFSALPEIFDPYTSIQRCRPNWRAQK